MFYIYIYIAQREKYDASEAGLKRQLEEAKNENRRLYHYRDSQEENAKEMEKLHQVADIYYIYIYIYYGE